MQDFLARMNIERFQRLISEERDPENRVHLERMLVEEQEKLRACDERVESASHGHMNDGSDRQ